MAELSKDVAVGEPTGAGPRLYIDRRGAQAGSEIERDPAALRLPIRDGDPPMSKRMERYAAEWLASGDVRSRAARVPQRGLILPDSSILTRMTIPPMQSRR